MREVNPFGYRASRPVQELIRRAAQESGRSLNSQIEHYCKIGLRLDGYVIPREAAEQGASTPRTA